eukprot:m.55957 g.55957  ORF g.55957 m.55957 type:complete len:393 (-) comp9282_c0_seq1:97-1275(-)
MLWLGSLLALGRTARSAAGDDGKRGCHSSSLKVLDGRNHAVCACVGDRTVCVPGSTKCLVARNLETPKEDMRHSQLIRQSWPTRITPNMSSILPFPNKLQGFRPACKDCKCVAPCKETVFVLGCGHSGTTYLTRLIGAHPAYSAIMAETGWFSTYGGTRVAFESFRKESVGCGRAGKRVLVEKTPKHVLSINSILKHFPSARVLFMYRDGRDVALSLAKRFQYPLENRFAMCMAAGRWVTDNRAASAFSADARVLSVQYEELIADPHGTVDRIFTFLEHQPAPPEVHRQFEQRANLTWGRLAPVLEEPKTRPPGGPDAAVVNKHLRNWQINQLLYDGRGKWIAALTDAHLKGLYECHGFAALMKEFGYISKVNKSQWYDRTTNNTKPQEAKS